jgi:hypothetical protein
MRIRAIIVAAVLLSASFAVPLPAAAQAAPLVGGVVSSGPSSGQQVVIINGPSFAETALSACAGGAAIGYLAVLATGAPTPASTAALFCGLSVAATAASTIAVVTWNTAASLFR